MHRILILIFLLPAIAGIPAQAQQKTPLYQLLNLENGLPSNEVYCIHEDRQHQLWIATDQGLVRFNGKKNDRFELPDNVVFKIREDKHGRLYFFSQTGAISYFEHEQIIPFPHNDLILKNIPKLALTDAYIDSSGNFLFNNALYKNYTINLKGDIQMQEYYYANPEEFTSYEITEPIKDHPYVQRLNFNPFKTDSIHLIWRNQQQTHHYYFRNTVQTLNHYSCVRSVRNRYYFAVGKSLVRLDPDNRLVVRELPGEIVQLNTSSNGHVWACMLKKGVLELDENLDITSSAHYLDGQSVSWVLNDFEGNTWISTTENGIYWIKDLSIQRLTGNNELNAPVLQAESTGDGILFATNNGLFWKQNQAIIPIIKEKLLTCSDIQINGKDIHWAITRGKDVSLPHIVTNSPITRFHKIYIFQSTSKILFDKQRKFTMNWVNEIAHFDSSLFTNGTIHFQRKGIANLENFQFYASKLLIDSKDQVWLGTIHGLYRMNPATYRPVKINPGNSTLFNIGITALAENNQGLFAAGIRFKGLVLFRDQQPIGHITEKDGLLSNTISTILFKNRFCFIAGPKGANLIYFESEVPLKYRIIPIGLNKGLFNLTIYQIFEHQQRLYAATSKGLIELGSWESLSTPYLPELPLNILQIRMDGKNIPIRSGIVVQPDNKRLSIHFNSPCYNAVDELEYRYRLLHEGDDSDWHTQSASPLVLENLSPGDYQIELKAVLPHQFRYSATTVMTVTVNKPWWLNPWLILVLILLGIAGIYWGLRRRFQLIRQRDQEQLQFRQRLTALEQTALRSQMNPHFIFNCLTSIQHLIISGKNKDANEYLVAFARLIRTTLDLSTHSFISIAEEQDYIRQYVALEQLRLPDSFTFSLRVDPAIATRTTVIPNMILQPIVENAIRHGLKPLKNRLGKLEIHILQTGSFISCKIMDNGVGYNPAKRTVSGHGIHKSLGLDNVRKRLNLLFPPPEETVLEINPIKDPDTLKTIGTCVSVRFPNQQITPANKS